MVIMGLPGNCFPTVVSFWDWLGPDKIVHLFVFGILSFSMLWGYRKKIIIVATGFADIVMINPVITAKSEPYETEEGCLSLPGTRKTTRYKRITVRYLNKRFDEHVQDFSGYIAQIIHHEIDHFSGKLI